MSDPWDDRRNQTHYVGDECPGGHLHPHIEEQMKQKDARIKELEDKLARVAAGAAAEYAKYEKTVFEVAEIELNAQRLFFRLKKIVEDFPLP